METQKITNQENHETEYLWKFNTNQIADKEEEEEKRKLTETHRKSLARKNHEAEPS